ncbi:MAG TPA: hypothetical protein PLP34_06570, partial [Chitinophagaceae bacterium]|nr:hypothetical protein [Chitinophagaceae bacterium]
IATASFASSLSGTYYIGIRHRNTIESWSSVPVSLSSGSYDFTTAANKAFGSNQILVDTGKWALYSGDLNTDDNVDLLDMSLQEVDINNFGFGYLVTDINGDGNVDLIDTMVMESNISDFIFSIHP